MSSLGLSSSALAETIAETVLEGFNKHFRIFQKITAGAMGRYETEDWMAERDASRKRMLFYDKRADEAVETLREIFGQALNDMAVWKQVKVLYIMLLHDHKQPELAETFYNTVFCRMFDRTYFNNEYIFVRSAVSTEYIESDRPAYHVYYPAKLGLRTTIRRVLKSCHFTLPFEDM